MHPCMQHNPGTHFFTISDFIAHLRGSYLDPDLAMHAKQKLQTIRQGDRPVIDYIAEFDEFAPDLPACKIQRNEKKSRRIKPTPQVTGRLAPYVADVASALDIVPKWGSVNMARSFMLVILTSTDGTHVCTWACSTMSLLNGMS